MKTIIFISLLISTVFGSYLSGLDRSFSEADFKIIDLYVSMPPSEVEKLISIAQIGTNQVSNGNAKNIEDFEYKEATMVAKLNGEETVYENVTFKTGGMYARSMDKVGFNFKLNKKFLGRKQLRIRPDPHDKSYMRSKLSCDIANRIGVPSIQSAYARLYMNDEFWGLYTLMDAIKPSWIKQTFNPAVDEVTNLFQCKYDGMTLKVGSESKCINANDDYPDMTKFSEFVRQVNQATTTEELEQIMDVDEFLKLMAMEWLVGSFDHFLVLGHNFYFYQKESDNKWVIIEYDYDNTFGNGLVTPVYWMGKRTGASSSNNNNNNNNGRNGGFGGGWGGGFGGMQNQNVIEYSFAEWELDLPIIKILVLDNPERFKKIVREVLISAFNPSILNDHIDQIKQFLLPYVQEDTTPGRDGSLPGRINKRGTRNDSSVSKFESNIERNTDGIEGIKSWIKGKFEVACKQYEFDQNEILSESSNYVPKSYDYQNGNTNNVSNNNNKNNNNNNNNNTNDNCWSNELGYRCCVECNVVYTDNDGQWGIENGQWCGIKESTCNNNAPQCYGESTGEYPCCTTCDVYYTDHNGNWGVENNDWCSTNYSC